MRLALPASAAVGAGAGALVIWIAPGVTGVGVKARTSHARLHPVALGDNKQPLTKSELAGLVRWTAQWRACAERKGLDLARPRVGHNEVVLAARRGSSIRQAQLRRTFTCGDALGGPPPFTAFVLTRAGSLHLYRPRACLLPVTKENA